MERSDSAPRRPGNPNIACLYYCHESKIGKLTIGIDDYLKLTVLLGLNTNPRHGELFSLGWQDIDLGAARLTVHAAATKGGKSRHLLLNGVAQMVLCGWREQCVGEGLVF